MKVSDLAQDIHAALLVVDQQIDFEPGGALAVEGGDKIVDAIAALMNQFKNIFLTQDSHPVGHISFASSYEGKKPFELLTLDEVKSGKIKSKFSKETLIQYLERIPGGVQMLWPDHCVKGSEGWKLDPRLPVDKASKIFTKGTRADCDSYSAFFENDGTSTGLSAFLRERKIDSLFICGLAGDYCVLWSIEDAIREGFKVYFDERLTAYVNFPAGSREKALEKMQSIGVHFLS